MTTTSITELTEQLDKALIDHNTADKRAIAASRSKDQQQNDAQHAEMLRLEKEERALVQMICASRARTNDEAISQAITAMHLVKLIAEGTYSKKKHAERASTALLSALSVLIDLADERLPATFRRRYFDVWATRRFGEEDAASRSSTSGSVARSDGSSSDRGDTIAELDSALTHLLGLEQVLFNLACPDLDEVLSYLSSQLGAHREKANDAVNRLFGLNEYSAQSGGPGPLVIAAPAVELTGGAA